MHYNCIVQYVLSSVTATVWKKQMYLKLIHLPETEIDQLATKYEIRKSGKLTDYTNNSYTSLTKYVKLIHLPEIEMLKIDLKLREITSNKLKWNLAE